MTGSMIFSLLYALYIMKSQSTVSYLVLNYLLLRQRLPLARLAPGILWLPWLAIANQFRSFWHRFLRLFGFLLPVLLLHFVVSYCVLVCWE